MGVWGLGFWAFEGFRLFEVDGSRVLGLMSWSRNLGPFRCLGRFRVFGFLGPFEGFRVFRAFCGFWGLLGLGVRASLGFRVFGGPSWVLGFLGPFLGLYRAFGELRL